MTSNQTPASNSDARKRRAEKESVHVHGGEPMEIRDNLFGESAIRARCFTAPHVASEADQPPTLPDTSGWVRREVGDVIEAGTRYVVKMGGRFITTGISDGTDGVGSAVEVLTPPPPEPESEPVWSVLSTDREKPTLARVTYTVPGKVDQSQTARVYHSKGTVLDEWDYAVADLEQVVSVELLHTHDPVTQVPVDRAPSADSVLVRELRLSLGLTCPDEYTAIALRSALAALADGAEKGAES